VGIGEALIKSGSYVITCAHVTSSTDSLAKSSFDRATQIEAHRRIAWDSEPFLEEAIRRFESSMSASGSQPPVLPLRVGPQASAIERRAMETLASSVFEADMEAHRASPDPLSQRLKALKQRLRDLINRSDLETQTIVQQLENANDVASEECRLIFLPAILVACALSCVALPWIVGRVLYFILRRLYEIGRARLDLVMALLFGTWESFTSSESWFALEPSVLPSPASLACRLAPLRC
jgi:hypothetical protein